MWNAGCFILHADQVFFRLLQKRFKNRISSKIELKYFNTNYLIYIIFYMLIKFS